MGTHGYDLADLRTDLDRFTFLLGDDGEHLFGTGRTDHARAARRGQRLGQRIATSS
jgi:hypothetical protein